jgi:8-oxo-dGTP diphosphatase
MPQKKLRRRATAIIESSRGILLVGARYMAYALPGGGIKAGEAPEAAIVREVFEETTLAVTATEFLFEYCSYASHHFVYRIEFRGLPKPSQEVQFIAYFPASARLRLSPDTVTILGRYVERRT